MKKKIKLLCIDDDVNILKLIGVYFERHGYTVLKAKDGAEGLRVFEAQKPDIVLVDLKMPNVDGFEVLETIHEKASDLPVLVISGEGEMADVIQALQLGAWNYQLKPIENLAIIKHAVEQALEKALLKKENKAYQAGLEQKLYNIINNFNGFVFTCDNQCRVKYMNTAFINHIGFDATGKKCGETLFNSDSDCLLCREQILVEGKSNLQEIQISNDGRWYNSIQSPIRGHDGIVEEFQVLLIDITEQKNALLDLEEREEYLRQENIRLKTSLSERFRFGNIIGKSKPMQEVYKTILNASASDAGVIIYGESGTGKELVAKAIHENSSRKENELVYVNCGAIPENLIESEFFGYKKGAFTGAIKDKHGLLDFANKGTLFLDEVGEIPLNMQVKLLRALDQGGYTPIGSTELKTTDMRIIAATNKNLKDLVRQGLMRQDFFYRIHIIPINLPSLKKRRDDIPFLVEHFLTQYDPKTVPPVTTAIAKALQKYDWPGNVRELQNTLHRFVTLKKIDFMGLDYSNALDDDEIDFVNPESSLSYLVDQFEKKILKKSLEKYNWHKIKAAKALKINRKTLFNKMKRHNLDS